MKNLATFYIRLENDLETARTSHDTGKTPLINYVIGNNKKRKIFKKKQSLEYAGTGTWSTMMTSERPVSYKSINNCERKKVFFPNSLASLGLRTIQIYK